MRQKICLSVLSSFVIAFPALANDYKKIYPFTPFSTEEIKSRVSNLSEDSSPLLNVFEIERQRLSQGKTQSQPWSGPFWPIKFGMIANPYQERTVFSYAGFLPLFDAIKPYEKRNNYIISNEALLDEEALSKLAPSEKYDLLLGNQLDLSNRVWDYINKWKNDRKWEFITSIDLPGESFEIEKKNRILANWEGICHGWAPASGIVPKPEKTVVATLPDGRKLPFHPEDIKALVSLTWANSLVQDQVISEGWRCNKRNPKRDKWGRYYDTELEYGELLPRCADMHPAVYHLALVNLTGKQGRSFVFDKDGKLPIANQPLAGYKFKYFHPDNGEDLPFNEALTAYAEYRSFDPFKESRNPATKYIIGVEATITYADWTMPKDFSESESYLKDKTGELTSLYDLEIDQAGNIVGGQWRGYKDLSMADAEIPGSSTRQLPMVTTRPDFMWVIPKNYKNYFKHVQGLENWSITSGTQAPQSWKNAAKAAHSFHYENSKFYGNEEKCRVKDSVTGQTTFVKCEFKYPRPQPLIQIVDQLIDLSKK